VIGSVVERAIVRKNDQAWTSSYCPGNGKRWEDALTASFQRGYGDPAVTRKGGSNRQRAVSKGRACHAFDRDRKFRHRNMKETTHY
jgi:hypothetical protein